MKPLQEILLPARYGLTHKLKHIGGNLWLIELDKDSIGTYRIIGYPNNITALDPEGGPFLNIGCKINGYVIKSITSNGIFELIKDSENENS